MISTSPQFICNSFCRELSPLASSSTSKVDILFIRLPFELINKMLQGCHFQWSLVIRFCLLLSGGYRVCIFHLADEYGVEYWICRRGYGHRCLPGCRRSCLFSIG